MCFYFFFLNRNFAERKHKIRRDSKTNVLEKNYFEKINTSLGKLKNLNPLDGFKNFITVIIKHPQFQKTFKKYSNKKLSPKNVKFYHFERFLS